MHGFTDYSDNSMYEMQGGTYKLPLELRDSDGDPLTPGPIDCIKTRGVNIKQNWLGEVIHFQNIITQTFDIFFVNPSTSKNLQKWIDKLEEFEDVGGWREELDLYGIKIENCRITNISAPTSEDPNQNAVGRGQLNITVEQRVCGDTGTTPAPGTAADPLSSLEGRERTVVPPCYQCTLNGAPVAGQYVQGVATPVDNAQSAAVAACKLLITTTTSSSTGLPPVMGAVQAPDTLCADPTTGVIPGSSTVKDYAGLQAILKDHCPFIDDIKEDFTFNYGKGENISLNHSVSIKLFDSCPKGVDPMPTDAAGFAIPPGTGGPGTPGAKVPINTEGFPGVYEGDDGDPTDGFTVCRTRQYNVDDALGLARKILDKNTPHFGIAFHGGVLRTLDDPKGDGTGGNIPGDPVDATKDQDRIIPYYSETQNLVTGEVTMAKRLTLLKEKDAELKWSADYNHSLSVSAGGIVTVSEKGKIRGNKTQPLGAGEAKKVTDSAYQNALNGMDALLGDDFSLARTRCEDFWKDYREFYKNSFGGAKQPAKNDPLYGLDNIDLKVEHPMEKTRNFNEISRECSYSISFSTSADIFENFMANRTLTASKGKFGSITIKEKSDLISYTPKGEDYQREEGSCSDPAFTTKATCEAAGETWTPTGVIEDCADDPCAAGQQLLIPCPDKVVDNPIVIMFPEDYKGKRLPGGGLDPNTGARARAMSFYNTLLVNTIDFKAANPQGCTQPLKLWSRNINWSPSGRGLTYDVEFTTDKTVSCEYPDPHGIRKTEVSVNDKLPKRMHKEHPIANNKMMVHDSFQTRLGSRTVKLNISLERIPKHNMLKDPLLPDVALKELMTRAHDEVINVFADHEGLIADDMFLKSCKFTFNSRWKATVTVAVDYLQKQ